MGKVLLTKKNIEQYISKEENKIYIDGNMILTPGAKDIIRSMGTTIVYDEKPIKDQEPNYSFDTERIKNSIAKILKEDYSITDNKEVDKVCNVILDKMKLH